MITLISEIKHKIFSKKTSTSLFLSINSFKNLNIIYFFIY